MKVFVSHSSHDKWVARQISRVLEEEGHTTFLDEKDIKTGDSIDGAIQEHLKESDHLVLLLSPASISSQWVFIELGGAKILGKKIVPITFHLGANEIPSALSQLLARDINEFDRYLDEIRTRPGEQQTTPQLQDLQKVCSHPEPIKVSGTQSSVNGYQVGDKVRIVDTQRLTDEDNAQLPVWVPGMDKFSGLETHITDFVRSDTARLAVDEGLFLWSLSWLSKSEQ